MTLVFIEPAAANPVWPLLLFTALTLGTFGAMLLGSWLLGERRPRERETPYESGILPTGPARGLSPQFYLVGMLFVIFDVEAAFLLTWALVVREAGWLGFVEATIFAGVLFVSLVWLWRVGALDWGAANRRVRHPPPEGLVGISPPSAER